VSCQGNIVVFSWSVSAHGKAQLAANGHSPLQEVQRSRTKKAAQPFGLRLKKRHSALLVVRLEPRNFSPRASPKAPTVGDWRFCRRNSDANETSTDPNATW